MKPVVTKLTDGEPLEGHAINCDRSIGNDIKSGLGGHRSLAPDRLVMRITTISCLPPSGMCFSEQRLGWGGCGGVRVTQSDCGGGIDKEHWLLLSKNKCRRSM